MASDTRGFGRWKVRKVLVLAPAAVLSMVACSDGGGVDLTATLRSDGAAVGTSVADIQISSDRTRVCWEFRGLAGAGDVAGMHIHSGPASDVGPVVAEFHNSQGCHDVSPAGGVSEAALRDITDDPGIFYVDIHGKGYPDGSIRGQLESRGGGE